MAASSPTGSHHVRHNSLTGSIKSVLSNLKRAGTNASHGSNSDRSITGPTATPTRDDILNIPPDPLPDNPRDLEGLLNRQLSSLDHLRRTVEARNQEIKDYCTRASYYDHVTPRASPGFLRQFDAEVAVLRAQRNGLQALVQMRHNEIVRMAEHRKMLDAQQGHECTVYDMYLGFRQLEVWEQLFSI